MDWSALSEVVLLVAIAVTAIGAFHRATQAHEMGASTQMQLAFLRDRLGISDAEVDEWHRKHHPDCFDDESTGPDGSR